MKNKASNSGIVFSTNPDFKIEEELSNVETLSPPQQRLIVQLDNKRRAGKTVTLITGFIGTDEDLEILSKQLKTLCGTGGTAKDAEIIIQGNHTDKILVWLKSKGYQLTKKK